MSIVILVVLELPLICYFFCESFFIPPPCPTQRPLLEKTPHSTSDIYIYIYILLLWFDSAGGIYYYCQDHWTSRAEYSFVASLILLDIIRIAGNQIEHISAAVI